MSTSTAVFSPWKKLSPDVVQQPVVNLGDIMSEELAQSLQSREEQEFEKQFAKSTTSASAEEASKDPMEQFDELDCSNDFLLAQYLQMEFDKEHDRILSREEQKYNGNDKGESSSEI